MELGAERCAGIEQGVAHVAQQDQALGAVVGRRHHGVVDDRWQPVQEPALPQPHVRATRVARGPEQPIVARVLVLEDELLPVDDQTFEAGARLGVLGYPGPSSLRAGEQIVQARMRRGRRRQPAHPLFDHLSIPAAPSLPSFRMLAGDARSRRVDQVRTHHPPSS